MKHFYKYKAAFFCLFIVCIAGQCPRKSKQTSKEKLANNAGNNNKQMLQEKFEKIWKNKIENKIVQDVKLPLSLLDEHTKTNKISPDQLKLLKEECITTFVMPNIQEAKQDCLGLPYQKLKCLVTKLEQSKDALQTLRREGPELANSKVDEVSKNAIIKSIDLTYKKHPNILSDTNKCMLYMVAGSVRVF